MPPARTPVTLVPAFQARHLRFVRRRVATLRFASFRVVCVAVRRCVTCGALRVACVCQYLFTLPWCGGTRIATLRATLCVSAHVVSSREELASGRHVGGCWAAWQSARLSVGESLAADATDQTGIAVFWGS